MYIRKLLSRLQKRRICGLYYSRLYTCVLLVTFSLGFFAGITIFSWFARRKIFWLYNKIQYSECNQNDIDFQRFIAGKLEILLTFLEEKAFSDFQLLKLRGAILSLDPQKKFAFEISKYPPNSREVCGEIYTGEKDEPYYRKGFVTDPKCDPTKLPDLETLVTILLLEPRSEVGHSLIANSIVNLLHIYPDIRIVVASDQMVHTNGHSPETKIVFADSYDFRTPGRLWNQLAKLVRSPYVLVARDAILVDELARLSRLIYVLSVSGEKTLAVAGGAVRDPFGHWRAGCLQTNLRRYGLRFQRDYRVSALDCMLCDHLEGPFVVRTSLLQEIPFNEDLPASVIFEDWFLRIKRHGYVAAACPDALFFVNDTIARQGNSNHMSHKIWRPLAKLWHLDRVITPNGKLLKFQCQEVGLVCDLPEIHREGLLMPSCCIDQILKKLAVLHLWAKSHRIDYELAEGTALGAVKLRGIMPWDIDGDVFFRLADFATFKRNRNKIKQFGVVLTGFTTTPDSKYFVMKTPEISIDMWGLANLSSIALPTEFQKIPTLVEVNNMWLRGYWNPGLAARNRYGPEYLKHAVHWSKQGMATHMDMYNVGIWSNCSIIYHPSCLNRYPTDGSFHFNSIENF